MRPKMSGVITVRTLTTDDAAELTRLIVANREAHAPFKPVRTDGYFTVEGQHERLASSEHLYGIIEDEDLFGMITLSILVRGPFRARPSATGSTRRGAGEGSRRVRFALIVKLRGEAGPPSA